MNFIGLLKHLTLCTAAAGLLVTAGGCEVNSFLDPSVVGRWERTPVKMPILDRLDIIEGPREAELGLTPVRPADLIPDRTEYVIGTSDVVQVNIFELILPGQDTIQQRRVDETGSIRLQLVGPITAEGLTPSQLERHIAQKLEEQGILRDPTVSVIMVETRQNTFSIMGEPRTGGTNVGTYPIPRPDFRLLDAIAMARGISGRTKKLIIIRQVPLDAEVAGEARQQMQQPQAQGPQRQAPEDPTQLIEEMMEDLDEPGAEPQTQADQPTQAPPSAIEGGVEEPRDEGQWVNVGGKWMKVQQAREAAAAATEDGELGFEQLITQRLIEVPYQRLVNGDMRYNLVIRPGDIIRVPDPSAGFVYIMGQTNRPGAYNVPGEAELTLTQLIASSGGLGGLAVPERTEIRRRVGEAQEAILRIDLRAIFEGTEPNFFLKPNDEINIGTNFVATPLAVFRNGLRATYGFGFILDRNFGFDVFPP